MALASFYKVSARGLKSNADRKGLDDDDLERMKKINRHGSKYVLEL